VTAPPCGKPALYYVPGTPVRLCRVCVKAYVMREPNPLVVRDPAMVSENIRCTEQKVEVNQ
jgi:hypothetical protein